MSQQTPPPYTAPLPGPAQPVAAQPHAPQQAPQPVAGTTVAATNTYALLSIIFAFLVPIAAIIFGHLGLNQIKRTGDAGRGLALTGTIIGYAYFVMIALFFIIYIGFIIVMFGAMGAAFSGFDSYSELDPYTY